MLKWLDGRPPVWPKDIFFIKIVFSKIIVFFFFCVNSLAVIPCIAGVFAIDIPSFQRVRGYLSSLVKPFGKHKV